MADVTVRVRDNGPLLIEGAFVMTDGENKEHVLPVKPAIALCRCGASQNKPFCDGAHKAAGFQSSVRSPAPAAPAPSATGPSATLPTL